MRKSLFLSAALMLFFAAASFADRAESLDEAKRLSAQTGKPILMEFVHQD